MARPGTKGRRRQLRLGYLAKNEPSSSGVALYSTNFEKVLKHWGRVERIGRLHEPKDSQRLSKVLRTCIVSQLAATRLDLLFVEISGRAVAELWTALLWTVSPLTRRKPLLIMVHDAPELTGSAFQISLLDRRGGWRVAWVLHLRFGRAVEARIIRRACASFCLSGQGANAVAERLGVERLAVLPHVLEVGPERRVPSSDVTIFCPGYTSMESVRTVTDAMRRTDHPSVSLIIGAMDAESELQIEAFRCENSDVTIEYVGFVTGRDDLLGLFERADIVCRFHSWETGRRGANWAAVGGPLLMGAAYSCAICTNDGGGAAEEFELANAARFVLSREEAVEAIAELVRIQRCVSPSRIERRNSLLGISQAR